MFPLYEEDLTYHNLELFLEVEEDIMTLSREYLQDAKMYGDIMVGVHLRRGDHKYFNCNQRAEKLPGHKGQQVLDEWLKADNDFEDRPQHKNTLLI